MKTKLAKITLATSLSALILSATFLSCLSLIPQTAKAETAQTATKTAGLITPKETDPIVFTTSSGIDIKYGNSLPDTYGDSLASGNLAGFPYFTTSNGSTTYTWVIIGQGIDMSGVTGKQHLDATPAGTAISTDPKFDLAKYFGGFDGNVVANAEIPSNCILALSNSSVGTCAYYSPAIRCTDPSHTFAGTNNTLRQRCQSYYTSDTFGFGTYINSLKLISLKQIGLYTANGIGENRYDSTTSLYFFPLDIGHEASSYYSYNSDYLGSKSNFRWETYLSRNQFKLTNYVMGRTMFNACKAVKMRSDGVTNWDDTSRNANTLEQVRPACVLSLL